VQATWRGSVKTAPFWLARKVKRKAKNKMEQEQSRGLKRFSGSLFFLARTKRGRRRTLHVKKKRREELPQESFLARSNSKPRKVPMKKRGQRTNLLSPAWWRWCMLRRVCLCVWGKIANPRRGSGGSWLGGELRWLCACELGDGG
jgi:hypothetical protein